MTVQEAIKIIEVAIAEVEWDYPMDYAIAFEKAIEALKVEDKLTKMQKLAMKQLSELLHKSELNPEDDLCSGMTYDGDRILEMRICPLQKRIEEQIDKK